MLGCRACYKLFVPWNSDTVDMFGSSQTDVIGFEQILRDRS